MGIFTTWNQIVENTGQATFSIIDDINEAIRQKECELWNKYTQRITSGPLNLNSWSRMWMNKTCSDGPTPAPPTVPFSGGQCCDKAYTVTVDQVTRRCFNNDIIAQQTLVVNIPTGKINGTVYQQCLQSPSLSCLDVEYEECDGTIKYATLWSATNPIGPPNCFTTSPFDPNAGSIDVSASTADITNIVVTNGDPDTCGDPEPMYPPPPPLDPADFSGTFTFNSYDGGTIDIDYNIVLENNDLNQTIQIPHTWNVGGLTVQVNLGGIQINNNEGNITFKSNKQFLDNGTKHPVPLDLVPPAPDLEEPPPSAENFDEEVKTPMDPKEEEVGEQIEYVKITVTQFPSNTIEIEGGQAPTVYFLGWFTWLYDGVGYRREWINFENHLFKAPKGATGYAYHLYIGSTGFATVYTTKNTD